MFCFGRVICGLGIGSSSYLVPLYSRGYLVREIAPIEIYAQLGSVNQFMITFGIFISYVIGYCEAQYNNSFTKYLIFGLPIFIAIIQTILIFQCYQIETPTYFLKNKQSKRAVEMMSKLYYMHEFDDSNNFSDDFTFDRKSLNFKEVFKSLPSNKALKLGCLFAALQQLSGINFLIFTSSEVYSNKGFTVLLGAINCVAGTFGMIFLRKHYKKNLLIGGIGMSLCYILMIIFTNILKHDKTAHQYFIISITFTFISCFEFSVGPILWIYIADILCERGIAITSSINWMCSTFVVALFGFYGNKSKGGLYQTAYLFYIYCSFCLFFCLCVIQT